MFEKSKREEVRREHDLAEKMEKERKIGSTRERERAREKERDRGMRYAERMF